MTDNSTFKSIAEESAVEVSETAEAPVETQEVQSEEPKVESFAEDKDLNGLSPEQLLQTKKEWEKAYTIKRQKETAEIKEFQRKIAELEARVNQPQQPESQGVEEKAQEAARQVELGNMSVEEYTEYMKSVMAEQARQVAREEFKSIQSEEREAQLQTTAMDQFRNADSRLNDHSPEYNESFATEVRREVADLLDQHLAEYQSYEGFDAATLTKQIIERRDRELDEIIKNRTQQSTQAARMREAKARKSEVRGTTSESQQVGGNSFRSILTDTLDSAS